MDSFEQTVIALISWVRLGIEILGALVIVIGVIAAVAHVVRVRFAVGGTDNQGFRHVRLVLSQYLAVALEFQLAADILGTTIAPSWTEIGKLAAVATIRTALNYFLERETRSMEEKGEPPPQAVLVSQGEREERYE